MAKKQQKAEERDELGFTQSDYSDMQKLADREGKLGDILQDGWDVTPEQITLINSPLHPLHRLAVITFYDVNYIRLHKMAYCFLQHAEYLIGLIEIDDLLQQAFCDLLGGWLKLPHNTEQIANAIYRCFRYTAVGGLEGVEDVKAKRTLCPSA